MNPTQNPENERVRDVLAHELLMAFGVSIQGDQEHVANVIMEKLWPEILKVTTTEQETQRRLNEQMSRWTHAMCGICWAKARPGETPYRIMDAPFEFCCWCRTTTNEGIFVRTDPRDVPCKGMHVERVFDDIA